MHHAASRPRKRNMALGSFGTTIRARSSQCRGKDRLRETRRFLALCRPFKAARSLATGARIRTPPRRGAVTAQAQTTRLLRHTLVCQESFVGHLGICPYGPLVSPPVPPILPRRLPPVAPERLAPPPVVSPERFPPTTNGPNPLAPGGRFLLDPIRHPSYPGPGRVDDQ